MGAMEGIRADLTLLAWLLALAAAAALAWLLRRDGRGD
jgi:hypothetical protein